VKKLGSNRRVTQGRAISTAADQELFLQRIGSLEVSILDICIRYLLLDNIGQIALFSVEQLAIEELPQEADLFNTDKGLIECDPCCT
jgi:hypothetical protein